MTIRFQCDSCHFGLSAPDDKAGIALKCPKCKAPIVIPLVAQVEDVVEVLPAEPAAPFGFDDAPAGVQMADLERGPYANCPFCRCPGRADKVSFTWWGGLLGPVMFSHVKCRKCGRAYNGKTGKPNDTAIAIYIAVSVALAVLFLCCAAIPLFWQGKI